MSYTSNPYAPKARKLATNLVKTGNSQAAVARMYGVHRSTIGRWMKLSSKHSREYILTRSSRPHHHPRQLPQTTVDEVITMRRKTRRCAQVLHIALMRQGVNISLASVKRILARYHLTRRKKVNIRRNTRFPRPKTDKPGAMIQVDTIHYVTTNYQRFYIYAVIDIYSRVGYAEYQPRLTMGVTVGVIKRAMEYFAFPVETVQTDNGTQRIHLGIQCKTPIEMLPRS